MCAVLRLKRGYQKGWAAEGATVMGGNLLATGRVYLLIKRFRQVYEGEKPNPGKSRLDWQRGSLLVAGRFKMRESSVYRGWSKREKPRGVTRFTSAGTRSGNRFCGSTLFRDSEAKRNMEEIYEASKRTRKGRSGYQRESRERRHPN